MWWLALILLHEQSKTNRKLEEMNNKYCQPAQYSYQRYKAELPKEEPKKPLTEEEIKSLRFRLYSLIALIIALTFIHFLFIG